MIRTTRLLCATVSVVLMGLTAASAEAPKMKMTTPIPDSIITPESLDTRLGKLNFFDGFPDDATSEKIYDDVGSAGPDKGKGGKYLLLPPGYQGEIPEGYFVFKTSTYGNLFFWRGFVENGSTATAVENTRKFAKVYPLSEADNPPPMK
ncbi:MAG: DUF1254 domain-containing protein, partial [Mesorhizobium sp.]